MAAIGLLNLLPLAGRPILLFHYKTIVLVVAAACLWLSQPGFSSAETKSNKNSDRFSVLVILIMSSLSVVVSVVEWAYFQNPAASSQIITLIGLLMLTVGISIRVWAIYVLGKHFTATATITNNHQLIKNGPYKLVRHPSYLGAFLAIAGCPVFLNAGWAFGFATVAMTLAYYLRISVEEKMLTDYFGEGYVQYKMQTKRIIPFIW